MRTDINLYLNMGNHWVVLPLKSFMEDIQTEYFKNFKLFEK